MRHICICFAICFILCPLASDNANAQLADSAWPKLRRDLGNTASTPATCEGKFKIRWIHTAPQEDVLGTPVIGPKDRINLVSTNRGIIYVLDTTGKLELQRYIGGIVKAVPAIGVDGTLYLGNDLQKIFYAIGSDGKTKWTHYVGGSVGIDSPTLGVDGTVYFVGQSLFALRPDGSKKWLIPTTFSGCPAIAPDGSIYVAGGNKLFSIPPAEGYAKSVYGTSGRIGTVVIDANGVIYFASSSGELYAVDGDGKLRWKYTVEEAGIRESSIALGGDGTVYIGSVASGGGSNYLYAVDSGGSLKWKREVAGAITIPAVCQDGTIFLTTQNDASAGGIHVLDRDGIERWKYVVEGQQITPPVVGSDGTIYFCSGNKLYAIATSNIPPIASAGPEKWILFGEKTVFDGTNSSDPDGNIVSYEWDFGDGESASGPRVAHQYGVPGMYNVGLTVVDEYGDVASTTTTINVVRNRPPILYAIQNKAVMEEEELSFKLKASDPDDNALTFTATNLPEGASFDTATGTFTWKPDKGSAGNYYGISFTVTSQGQVPLSASREMTIKVKGENRPPEFYPVEGKTVKVGESVRFKLEASDVDGDKLAFAASNLPPQSSFDEKTGTFSWTPGQAGTFSVRFVVADNGTPPLSDVQEVAINVSKANSPPLLMLPNKLSAIEGNLLNVEINALDAAGDVLTFSASHLPEGAEFDPVNRTLRWTPPGGSTGNYTVRFTATDSGTPPLSTTRDVTISVVSAEEAERLQIKPTKELASAIGKPTPPQGGLPGITTLTSPKEIIKQLRIIKYKLQKIPLSQYKKDKFMEKFLDLLNTAIEEVEEGKYAKAQGLLEKKVLKRMDGYISGDEPERGDWIVSKDAQLRLYPMVKNTADALGKL